MFGLLIAIIAPTFSWTFRNSLYLSFGIIWILLPLLIALLTWQRKQGREMVCAKVCIEHNRERIEDIHDSLDGMKKAQGDSREALARVEENQKSTKESLDKLVDRLGG